MISQLSNKLDREEEVGVYIVLIIEKSFRKGFFSERHLNLLH